MAADDAPFLSRWSRRKALVREGVPVDEAPPPAAPWPTTTPAPPDTSLNAVTGGLPAATGDAEPAVISDAPGPVQATDPPPTLADVAALTSQSDYTRFVAQGVTPDVKNAALKKLFTDPHYNVMDGLDTYIDDYNTPDPLPAGMLRQMVQSKLLGLFDDEDAKVEVNVEVDADPALANAAPALMPEATATATAPDEDLDLQLQPDPAAGRAGLAPGAGEDTGCQH